MYRLTHVKWLSTEIFIRVMEAHGIPYHYDTKVVVDGTVYLRDVRKRGWGY